jgi:hypothetical protein
MWKGVDEKKENNLEKVVLEWRGYRNNRKMGEGEIGVRWELEE